MVWCGATQLQQALKQLKLYSATKTFNTVLIGAMGGGTGNREQCNSNSLAACFARLSLLDCLFELRKLELLRIRNVGNALHSPPSFPAP